MRNRIARWTALTALAAITACAAGLRVPTAEDAARASAQYPGASLASLSEGRRVYVMRCSGCHTLYMPDTHGPDEWPSVLDEMAQKAKLSAGDRELVEQYLVTVSASAAAR